mmetsp:Transcript_9764/g.21077  ORF Transcript_9764/g.21077 Transcript_9764/m.21077 type:complete len:111 (+) Transcript_9764:1155-1487(+)
MFDACTPLFIVLGLARSLLVSRKRDFVSLRNKQQKVDAHHAYTIHTIGTGPNRTERARIESNRIAENRWFVPATFQKAVLSVALSLYIYTTRHDTTVMNARLFACVILVS